MAFTDYRSPLLPAIDDGGEEAHIQTRKKLDTRVLLLASGILLVAYIDRGNIGFAAKQLCNDLEMDHEQYGLGVTLFYAGYVLTQVFSNTMLRYISVPVWLSFIMVCWGLVAGAMAFIRSRQIFFLLRFLLGVAEGGTFPAIYYYLALFYPQRYKTGAYSFIFAATVLSMPIASPIAAGLLSLEDVVDKEGWRILFFVEGIIPLVYALICFLLLPRTPQTSSFLTDAEKQWIEEEHVASEYSSAASRSVWNEAVQVLKIKEFWSVGAIGLLDFGISNCLMFWSALIIDDMLYGDDDDDGPKTCGSKHGSKVAAVLLTTIPYLVGAVGCLVVRWSVDGGRIPNRSHFCVAAKALTGICLLSWVGLREVNFELGFIALTGAIGSIYLTSGMVASIIVDHMAAPLVRTGTAMFNIVASAGQLFLPQIIGKLIDDVGYGATVAFCASCIFLCAFIILFVSDPIVEKRKAERVALITADEKAHR